MADVLARPTGTPSSAEDVAGPSKRLRAVLRHGWIGQVGLVLVSVVTIVVIWELVVVAFSIPQFTLPTPVSVASTLVRSTGSISADIAVTVEETLVGFAAAIVVGIPLAVAIASSRLVERLVYPMLVTSNAVPKIALAPVFIAWFGLGSVPRVVMAGMLALFPIVISTVVGLVGVDPALLLLGRAANAGAGRIFRLIRLPAALPSILGGLKVGVTLALTGAVVGEFVGGNTGLGYVIEQAQGNLRMSLAFAAIVLLAVIGVVLFYLIDLLEHVLLHGGQKAN
jgi:NitT/TauT family transport system permease protein